MEAPQWPIRNVSRVPNGQKIKGHARSVSSRADAMPLIKRVTKCGCRSGFVLGFAVALVVLQLFTFSQVTVLFEPGESSAPSHREARQLRNQVGVCLSYVASCKVQGLHFSVVSHSLLSIVMQ